MSIGTPQYESLTGFSPPSSLGPYRATDYWKLPEGEPVELIKGRLIVSPAPSFLHQTISLLLSQLVLDAARTGGGRAAASPIDVILADHTIVQPDLIYVAKERRDIVGDRINGPPDLVIEILSPSHVRRDRMDKLTLYAEFGVAEYWIVDPIEKQFDFLVLNDQGRFEVQLHKGDQYESPRLKELSIHVTDFWTEVDRHVGQQPQA
ncbi:MAG: Uma2 family endonuclease [Pirellulales bacterium]|nr:Uma2 family endonuclease [Pirellulales bacterium]